MAILITERAIELAAKEITANPECRVILTENGHYVYEDDGKTHSLCKGRLQLEKGKVKMVDTCGEPCRFVCDTSRDFQSMVTSVKSVIQAINKALEIEAMEGVTSDDSRGGIRQHVMQE